MLQGEVDRAFQAIFADTSFIMGKPVSEFEQEFAQYCGSKYCVTVHNGTAALHLALLAAGIGPGDEVITAANSFIATAEAISFAGATPVFVDCDANYNLDATKVEAKITAKTKAIIPVHLYGQPADMEPIMTLAKGRNLLVIEDACQGHGATYKGKRTGSIGDIGCFSFYPGKNLGAAGDGGAIVTNNEEFANRISLIRNHGSKVKYEHEIVGHNYRLDTLQAAVLKIKLPHLDEWNSLRIEAAQYYQAKLADERDLVLPAVAADRTHVYHLYVVRVKDRARVEQQLKASGVEFGIHYPKPIHLQKAYAEMGHARGDFPLTEQYADEILSLPMFPYITREQQDQVIDALKQALI